MTISPGETFHVIYRGVEYEFEAAEEGGYVVTVVDYPSCASEGDSFEEALGNTLDALRETLVTATELGLEIPERLRSVMLA